MDADLFHLLPSLDPLSGLHAYAVSLGVAPSQMLCPAPLLTMPHHGRRLVVHFSGYGYAANGAPASLVRQCLLWRAGHPQRRLLVVFHELFARQPPWRKGFWWAPQQRRWIRRLAHGSDGCLSTLDLHSHWLFRQGLLPHATLAVPSNVGESPQSGAWPQRQRRLVVFGGCSQRRMAYAALKRRPPRLDLLGIEGLDDVGPPLPERPQTPWPVRRHGLLPAAAIDELLASSAAAVVAYPHAFLAKSGIFAAICAHGCLPLVLRAGRPRQPQPDGLRAGTEFLTPDQLASCRSASCAEQTAAAVARAAWHWYQPHRIAEQRLLLANWISTVAASGPSAGEQR